ncbi:hypothetical protein F5Y11DRAFT_348990 [Daldinia sp. FL1419]|nr:hypothetical protein F5Y11DRAFT_348990 [Daldinia sp. FL1419]
MAPPPATPTPHRFLVPKRSQPRNETPKAHQGSGHQFHATPKFSHHLTPRGTGEGSSHHPPSSIPAPVPAPASGRTGAGTYYRPTPRTADPINDVIDSSPSFSEGQPQYGERGSHRRGPIEAPDVDVDTDVDAVPESSPVRDISSTRNESSESETDLPTRSPKRRRISISSGYSSDARDSLEHEDDFDYEFDYDEGDSFTHDNDNDIENADNEDTIMLDSHFPSSYDYSDQGTPEPSLPRPSTSAQQPTFLKAPRFKPIEASDGGSLRGDPLPDTFSPHRRGAKYVPGGLAASVRDWFVDVWAGGTKGRGEREGEWVGKVLVDGVRGAEGMVLVTGRWVGKEEEVGSGKGVEDTKEEGEEGDEKERVTQTRYARVVLAGSQKLVGLERGLDVHPGSVVGVGRPSWEVVIPGQGRWGVVCEWAVVR